MKLFMFYIGGNCGTSNVELHDVRFCVGATPEDCYADIYLPKTLIYIDVNLREIPYVRVDVRGA
jgi:hypothetical protein